jgi:hypothetical protein
MPEGGGGGQVTATGLMSAAGAGGGQAGGGAGGFGPYQSSLGPKGKFHLQRLLRHQGPTAEQGFQTLADIMAAQGRTDPSALNRELRTIERGTEGDLSALEGDFSARGLGSSGLLATLGAATRSGGLETRARAIERENALAEDRKRQDLEIMKTMLMDPEMQLKQLRLQRRALAEQAKQRQANTRAGKIAGLNTILSAGMVNPAGSYGTGTGEGATILGGVMGGAGGG